MSFPVWTDEQGWRWQLFEGTWSLQGEGLFLEDARFMRLEDNEPIELLPHEKGLRRIKDGERRDWKRRQANKITN